MWLTSRFLYALCNFLKFSPQIEPFVEGGLKVKYVYHEKANMK